MTHIPAGPVPPRTRILVPAIGANLDFDRSLDSSCENERKKERMDELGYRVSKLLLERKFSSLCRFK